MGEAPLDGVIEQARQGDGAAFAEVFRRFGGRVFGLCRHMLGSVPAAEDARNEVFARLPRTIASYDASLPFPRWLLSVASHHCVDVLRRRQLEKRLFVPEEETAAARGSDSVEVAPSPLSQALAEERREAIRGAIVELPERYRVPLVLRYYSELPYDAIAAQLGLKRSHVATLIFRAKQELRRTLGPTDEGHRP